MASEPASGDVENLPVLDGDVVGALARLLDPASVGLGGPTVVIDNVLQVHVLSTEGR